MKNGKIKFYCAISSSSDAYQSIDTLDSQASVLTLKTHSWNGSPYYEGTCTIPGYLYSSRTYYLWVYAIVDSGSYGGVNWPKTNFEYSLNVTGTIPTYTISYDANGGAGAPANQIKTHGIAIQLSSTKPTREGYTFQGWARSATGVVEAQPGNTYRGESNLTLYAIWKSNSATFHRYRPYIYNKTKNKFEPAKAYIRNNGTFIIAAPHIWFD